MTAAWPAGRLAPSLEAACRRWGDRAAVTYEGRTMSYAELAWRFVAWAIDRDDRMREVALASAARAIASARAMIVKPHGADEATWAAHGRLACAQARAVVERGVREILEPCLAALSSRRDEGPSVEPKR